MSKDWSEWWRGFLAISPERDRTAIDVLCQRYVDEMQGISQLTQHAYQMHYRQFCEKLLHIAADKSKHAEWLGAKITALGGQLPKVPERRPTDENSWQHLLTDLAEQKRAADRLPEQMWRIEADHPEISQFFQRIFEAEKKHREEITDMMMRSDGFARSLA